MRYAQTSTYLLTINGYDSTSRFLFGNYIWTLFVVCLIITSIIAWQGYLLFKTFKTIFLKHRNLFSWNTLYGISDQFKFVSSSIKIPVMEEGDKWKILKCISVLVIVVGGLISLLIIKSFSYLDYYEVSE